ncbi:type IV pilus assembly protein PilP [Thermotomaculum hydrothermale]|uniref:Type IV pilus assembly protein PilP n=1 Tax=Thermotomaculum hydrothermale TaxID=981385 RepID=A0A7R6PLN0_9BACT|nr:hypothetical protein [Thermotomaculum hydrothermale]BBB31853.1 type IV pilus assembly protein PilP [Thermotomaculum hydrothermale]
MKKVTVILIVLSFVFSGVAQVKDKKENKSQVPEVVMPFTYQPKSKRDPFISPFDLEMLKTGKKKKIPGIAGMSIDEIVLQGIIKSKKRGYEALVLGSDNKVYWIKPGDKLYDGEVLEIGMGKKSPDEISSPAEAGKVFGYVIFRQYVNDPSLIKPYKDIKKYLDK